LETYQRVYTQTEGWVSATLGVTAAGTGYAAKEMIKVGIASAAASTTNPVGWGMVVGNCNIGTIV
jgi:hypothetical protein